MKFRKRLLKTMHGGIKLLFLRSLFYFIMKKFPKKFIPKIQYN